MRYFVDTEFNSFGGAMLSLGMVNDNGSMLYIVEEDDFLDKLDLHPWVAEHVAPHLLASVAGYTPIRAPHRHWGSIIASFYEGDERPQFLADWPSDIADLCNMLITGPGTAVPMPHQTHFTILRHLDVYPTSVEGAIQHHALWDALALQRWVQEAEAR